MHINVLHLCLLGLASSALATPRPAIPGFATINPVTRINTTAPAGPTNTGLPPNTTCTSLQTAENIFNLTYPPVFITLYHQPDCAVNPTKPGHHPKSTFAVLQGDSAGGSNSWYSSNYPHLTPFPPPAKPRPNHKIASISWFSIAGISYGNGLFALGEPSGCNLTVVHGEGTEVFDPYRFDDGVPGEERSVCYGLRDVEAVSLTCPAVVGN